jgi:hypothetical protein
MVGGAPNSGSSPLTRWSPEVCAPVAHVCKGTHRHPAVKCQGREWGLLGKYQGAPVRSEECHLQSQGQKAEVGGEKDPEGTLWWEPAESSTTRFRTWTTKAGSCWWEAPTCKSILLSPDCDRCSAQETNMGSGVQA